MNNHSDTISKILDNVESVIVGKRQTCRFIVCALLCQGHVLIEDVPGVGKTSLAASLARSIDLSFKRIQFTPDILASDITGFTIYNQKTGEFDYHQGLVMANLILADEINRTSPKTQASLLEVMEEGQVTVDGTAYQLPKPFMVLATQNPVEYVGTYPLPEAQLDRFFMKLSLGYPTPEEELDILSRYRQQNPLAELKSVVSGDEISSITEAIKQIHLESEASRHIIETVAYTRNHPDISLGVSPRGSLALARAAQAWALMEGREFVIPDDIKAVAVPVLSHRIILKQEARIRKMTGEALVKQALASVKFIEKSK